MAIKAPLKITNNNGYGALNGIAIQDSAGFICAVAIGDVPDLDAPAMARLIAAAPAMLAALKAMQTEFKQLDLPYGSAAYLLAINAISDAEPTP